MNRNKVRSNTNRKMDLKKKMTAGLAVGMAGLMGTTPVFAAEPADKKVSKDETVYVNADCLLYTSKIGFKSSGLESFLNSTIYHYKILI